MTSPQLLEYKMAAMATPVA